MTRLEEIKSQAQILKEYLREGGFNITQSACYNAVAKMNGYENWNTFQAKLKTIEGNQ